LIGDTINTALRLPGDRPRVRAYSAISALDVLRRVSTPFPSSVFARNVGITPWRCVMSSLEIRVDPRAMGFDPARLERIAPHFDAYVEDRD